MIYPDDFVNKIVCGDCLPLLKELPDKCIDLVLTDPPYEAEAHTLQRRLKRGGGVMEVEALDFEPMNEECRRRSP